MISFLGVLSTFFAFTLILYIAYCSRTFMELSFFSAIFFGVFVEKRKVIPSEDYKVLW